MEELLQEIDRDYYRAARLLIAHAEIENLRRGSSPAADTTRRRKRAPGFSSSTDAAARHLLRPATAQSVSPEVDISG
jgi:hypothetical protein